MTSKLGKITLFFALYLSLSACDHNPDNGQVIQINNDQMLLPIPTGIRQIAALGDLTLEVQISVNGEIKRKVPVVANQDSVSTVVAMPANQSNEIAIAWIAIDRGQDVLLADFSTVVIEGTTVLDVTNHNTAGTRFDADGDGRTNLSEAQENRDMLSQFDMEVPFQTSFGGVFKTIASRGFDTDNSGDTPEPDANTTFSLRHNGTDLIAYVCGQDKTLQGDNLPLDGQYWHDDTIFIFIDGADSNNESYDTVDDFQFAFIRSTQEMRVSKGANNQFCTGGTCVTHTFFNNSTSCEYELTVNLPLAELNMTPGTAIGFDIEITDDDNGEKRDWSGSWIGFKDMSNLDPGTFGTINLN